MQLPTTPLILCLALTAADCSWDAPPNSDFITSGAGESVARSEILQAREIWPEASIDNDIVFDASRLVGPTPKGSEPSPLAGTDLSGSSSSSGSQ
jgi:hypothetical protein